MRVGIVHFSVFPGAACSEGLSRRVKELDSFSGILLGRVVGRSTSGLITPYLGAFSGVHRSISGIRRRG